MLELIDGLRDYSTLSVLLRMVLAVLCGGAIGIERENKRRPAGFRTHILICLGAAMVTLTSEYLLLEQGAFTDISRMGAQVISGVGFIGAGTIVVTRLRQVKGLTTAAGLWVSAIVGLALGAGYYEAGILTTVLVLLAELILSRLEYYIRSTARNLNIYIEYTDHACLDQVIRLIKKDGINILDLEITKSSLAAEGNSCAILSLQLNKKFPHNLLMQELVQVDKVISVEEL